MSRAGSAGARTALAVAAAAVAAGAGCRGALEVVPSDHETVLAHRTLEAPHPGRRGDHDVRTFYYGSGTDRRRAAYRDSVTLRTDPVDASKLVDLGRFADERNAYWGFTPEAFPVNGRVWYPHAPDAEGPFPLVLVVHGNHSMKEFSDPGYGYLGELLASRGFIAVSVDENFLNGSIRGENDARGWMLLKHLEAWRRFDAEEGSPLRGTVDLGRVALIGHSRGGEAVAVAAAFNELERYPDDASLEFDFGFGIRSVVAIAPVDGQYRPTDRGVPLEGVSYLVFHGSHDGDVSSFHGLRQYDRVSPGAGAAPGLKAAVYVYRANHGQWNTVWGNRDWGERSGRGLELRALIDGRAQRRMGRLYIGAFLETTLRGDRRYLPLFRDHRVAGEWLPETMYITRYSTPDHRTLADFEEDIDVTTGSARGVRLRGEGLSVWREAELRLRSSNRSTTSASQENQAVRLGWNRTEAPDTAPPPLYAVTIPGDGPGLPPTDGATSLELALAPTESVPPPESDERSEEESEAGGSGEGEDPGTGDDRTVSLSVAAEDARGNAAAVPLGRYGPIRKPLTIDILRRDDHEEERFARRWELVLQSYSIPLSDFVEANPAFEPSALREVRLVFDGTGAGEVVVDEIALARLDSAYWAAVAR